MASSGSTKAHPISPDKGIDIRNTVTLTIAGAATGGAELQVRIDGVYDAYTTIAAQSAADAATAWAAALGTALGTAYTIGVNSGVITIESPYPELVCDWEGSTDGTQSLTVSDNAFAAEALITDQTTAGSGAPTGPKSGFGVRPGLEVDDRTITVGLRADLKNFSGGAKTARWRLHWYIPGLGWVVDQEVGTRTITDAGSATPPLSSDAILVATSAGATRIAVELVDDGAGGNLANCALAIYGVVTH